MKESRKSIPESRANVGQRLRAERSRLGLSLEQLASSAGVCRATQANYESGRSIPKSDYLAKCRGIGLDISYVLGESKEVDVLYKKIEPSSLAADLYGIIERNTGRPPALALTRRQELLKELLELLTP